MAPSQPIAGDEVETGRGKKAETESQKQHIKHGQSPGARQLLAALVNAPKFKPVSKPSGDQITR
jgi:hypothetical protein